VAAVSLVSAFPILSAVRSSAVSISQNPKRANSQYVAGEILVRFRPGSSLSKTGRADLAVRADARQVDVHVERLEGFELLPGLRLARVAPEDTLAAIEGLAARSDVLYAEPNYIRRKDSTPGDPRYNELWGLKNTGQPINNHGPGIAGADIKAEAAWDVTTGSRSVVVGVIDEGIDTNHPDLAQNIWTNPAETAGNGVDDDANGFVDDVHGFDFFHNDASVYDGAPNDNVKDAHGTHVAGTIGAEGHNGLGVAGVNWQVSLMSLKVLGQENETPAPSSVAVTVRAYAYAKLMRERWASSSGMQGANIRVLNNSYGGGGFSQTEFDAIQALSAANILFVASAGNEAVDNDRFPHYPASYNAPNIISVMASNSTDNRSGFSNFGLRSVHLAAPGADILSTMPNSSYAFQDGTSMAAPHVAGVAALMCAQVPTIELAKLKASLVFGGEEKSGLTTSISGRRLSAQGALLAAAEVDASAPANISDFQILSQNGRSFTLRWTAPGDDGATGRAAAYEIRFGDTDISAATQFDQARALVPPRPVDGGTLQTTTVVVPYRHPTGFIGIRAVDNVGNTSTIAQLPVSINLDVADPYTVGQSGPSSLSIGGTALGLKADDQYLNYDYSLPFPIRYYGQNHSTVRVSTNGGLYFTNALPFLPNGDAADVNGSIAFLTAHRMVAGILDDLRTDRRAADDVYVVVPDQNTIIFRWQAVTFGTETPVSFEIEFKREGIVTIRFGDGNTNLHPVVGISAGEPDSYVATSHTSETVAIDLTNAPTLTFTPRVTPAADLRLLMSSSPNPVLVGQELTYNIEARNFGPDHTVGTVISDPLPAGTTFLSCTSSVGPCNAPPVGSNGTVSLNVNSFPTYPIFFYYVSMTITVRVTAPPGTTLVNTVSATSYFTDPDATNNSAATSVDVLEDTLFTGVRAIAAGRYHTIAAKTDGTVVGWGGDQSGQLGDGTFSIKPRPVQASGLTGVIAVAAGDEHSLALKSDGTVWSWGSNNLGELGRADGYFPAPVTGLTNVIAIAAGGANGLALKSDGTVWVWGDNRSGQLGDPNFGNMSSATPRQVVNLSDVTHIAMGAFHCLARKSDGTVWGWGSNQFGQLGVATPIATFSVLQVPGLTGASGVAGGYDNSVIWKSDGSVWSWGFNSRGQLGDGTFTTRSTPAQINNFSGASSLAAGEARVMALRTDGTVWAWGANTNGILGVGGTNDQASPAVVPGIANVTAVASGANHSVALLNDGTVRTWGVNSAGQIGDGTTTTRTTPTMVSGLTVVATPTFSVPDGTYPSARVVFVNCATAAAVIHYTLNGQDPTETDPVLSSGTSININQTTILKARAWRNGWLASSINTATYTISIPTNPIDVPTTFTRQQYLDFLAREPDQGGWDYWTGQITECGLDLLCVHQRRIGVSGAFFVELEFQRTGYVVYRLHRAAFGTWPGTSTRANITFAQFMADRPLLPEGADVAQSTINFANEFVQRPAFLTLHPNGQSNSDFVNQLFDRAGLTPYANERQQQIDAMNNSGKTRAQVLLDLIEIGEFKTREYNRSFVLMEYFGYLRRDPDQGGYDFWLNILDNREPDNYRAMVCAFLTSAEYQQRFGPGITRTNADCAQ
jgi:uncharacterized repeat protein (TIGR01451 family)